MLKKMKILERLSIFLLIVILLIESICIINNGIPLSTNIVIDAILIALLIMNISLRNDEEANFKRLEMILICASVIWSINWKWEKNIVINIIAILLLILLLFFFFVKRIYHFNYNFCRTLDNIID